ncbi:VPA1269 family protein [Dechloromonas denitrificans]|nr:VPA1269 family protein [Dechloromonas denitrificans]
MSEFGLKVFESPVTKRQISLNTHPTEFVWLHVPSHAEFEAVLREHERIRIQEAWEEWSALLDETSIKGFRPALNSSLRNLSTSAVARRLGYSRVRGVGEELRKLSVEEQRARLRQCMPNSYEELVEMASAPGLIHTYTQNIRQDFLNTGDVQAFVRHISSYPIAAKTGEQRRVVSRYAELLLMLRAKGWLLFATAFVNWSNQTKWSAALNPAYTGEMAGLLNEFRGHLDDERLDHMSPVERFGCGAILVSSMTELSDMSAPLIEELEAMCATWAETAGRDGGRLAGDSRWELKLGRALRTIWNHAHPSQPIAQKPHHNRKEILKLDGSFEWLVVARPEFHIWTATLARFVSQRTSSASKQSLITGLNFFCDFLSTLPTPPLSPERVERRLHIHDVTLRNKATFMQALAEWDRDARRKNLFLGYLKEFFDWVRDWLHAEGRMAEANAYVNPVTSQDFFDTGERNAQSFRTALPSWLLKELRETITDDDFAFFRLDQTRDWITVFDRAHGKTIRQWWPGSAVCLLVMLELPLRSHQARWLDSGLLDEFTLDHTTGKMAKNDHVGVINGRREGCIRQMHDTLRQETWCGLFVNTNKTAMYKSDKPGYEVPYLPPVLAEHLVRVREWSLRYLPPLAKPVLYAEAALGRHVYSEANIQHAPRVAPLFRDPTTIDKTSPVTYSRLARAYVRVLAETEKKVKNKYGVDIQLTEPKPNGKGLAWKYDLHTLRISGISAMIENGVPLEVVSQFVAGHASLLMTLWYLKSSPGKMREFIAKAHDKAAVEEDFVGSSDFLANVEQFSPFLLSKDSDRRSANGDVAFAAMKEHSGLWTISSDGICPGTACSEGGQLDVTGERYGAVPGGRRCGLCRFWLTGPAFILGQVAEVNNLIYQVRRKGQELGDARDQLIDQTDAGLKSKAAHTRNRIEALEREIMLDITEWQARYAFATESSSLLDEYVKTRQQLAADRNLPAPLLTTSSAEELKVTLLETNEFILIDHVTQMVDFLPGFKNREAMQEKHLILARLLEANDLPQFMLQLDAAMADEAANLLSSMLLQYVRAQDLPRVLAGDIKLASIPPLDEGIKGLAAMTTNSIRQLHTRQMIPLAEA